jgi:L-lactate dehydrogenase complex protein LldG
MNSDDALTVFAAQAEQAGVQVVVCDVAEYVDAVASVVEDAQAIYFVPDTELEKQLRIPADRITDDFTIADTCVEEVFGAIAETGSLALSGYGGKDLRPSLLASHHVAIITANNIYNNFDEFLTALGESPPTNITFETGPSKTADIELTLTTGVHGPEKVTVVVVR